MRSEEKQRLRVFLNHASEDTETVRNLYLRLKQIEGIEPWFYEEDLLGGQDIDLEIRRKVRNSEIFLACLSNKAVNKKGYVQRELNIALDAVKERPEGAVYVIPLRLEDCQVPESIERKYRIDLFEERGYEKLLEVLRKQAEIIGITILHKQELQEVTNELIAGEINFFVDLEETDILIFKALCEAALTIEYNPYSSEYIFANSSLKAVLPSLSEEDFFETLDILCHEKFIESDIKIGDRIEHFSITWDGFEAYARTFYPSYQTIKDAVISEIVKTNGCSSRYLVEQLSQPPLLIEHIFEGLKAAGDIDTLLDSIGLHVIQVSPLLKRRAKKGINL